MQPKEQGTPGRAQLHRQESPMGPAWLSLGEEGIFPPGSEGIHGSEEGLSSKAMTLISAASEMHKVSYVVGPRKVEGWGQTEDALLTKSRGSTAVGAFYSPKQEGALSPQTMGCVSGDDPQKLGGPSSSLNRQKQEPPSCGFLTGNGPPSVCGAWGNLAPRGK